MEGTPTCTGGVQDNSVVGEDSAGGLTLSSGMVLEHPFQIFIVRILQSPSAGEWSGNRHPFPNRRERVSLGMATNFPPGPGRILGIGGVFFKSGDAEQARSWYTDKLGIDCGEYGATFPWRSAEHPEQEHVTAWSIFKSTSDYFAPSTAPFMFNYIVDNLDAFLEKMAAGGVRIDPKREDHDYGRFAWIFDLDGNKIELWEPKTTPKDQ
jgi:catechol 2,3-dioxygenase-like lactoylglutathione lyase family enzyme